MPRILVPVDFSETAADALRFGTYLAELMDLDVSVLHVYDAMAESPGHVLRGSVRLQQQRKLQQRLEDFVRKHAHPVMADFQGRKDGRPALRTETVEGVPAPTMLWETTQEDIACVVMGGVGAGAHKQPPGLFGSVATRVALDGNCPVILIPKDYGTPEVRHLAMAFDKATELSQTFPFLKHIVKALHPQVSFVHVRGDNYMADLENDRDFVAATLGPDFPTEKYRLKKLPPGDVADRLVNYTVDERVDLLAVVGRRGNFLNWLLRRTNLQPLLRRSKVPLLVIPEKI